MDWIQRVTRTAVKELKRFGLKKWVYEQRQRKIDWAQKVAKMDDHRWAKALLLWQPDGTRKIGHPKLRWDDCFAELFAGPDGSLHKTEPFLHKGHMDCSSPACLQGLARCLNLELYQLVSGIPCFSSSVEISQMEIVTASVARISTARSRGPLNLGQ